jgi:integrase
LAKKRTKDGIRPGTLRHLERHILRTAKELHSLSFAGIQRRTVGAEIDAVGSARGKVAANRLQATLSELFTWAMTEGYCEQNPLLGRDTFAESPRERVLTDDELRVIWAEAGEDQYGDIIRLLMLSGQRADEIAGLRRSEIVKHEVKEVRLGDYKLPGFEVDVIDLPPARTKNRRRHLIPIPPAMRAILDRQPSRTNADGNQRDLLFGIGQRGFSGWSRCKQRLDERIHAARVKAWKENRRRGDSPPPLPHWTPHDLRRTLDTQLNDRFAVVPHVVEAILNHVSTVKSGKAGVAGTYNHAQYLREKTEALRLWSDHIIAVTGGNIVPLQAAE